MWRDRGFNCFNGLPHWLEEGLALFAEGGISQEMRRAFAEARLIEQFIPLRSFDVPFSPNTERDGRANTPTARTSSYGTPRATAWSRCSRKNSAGERIGFLLDLFKYGITVDDALKLAFGLDTEETERLWRLRSGLPELAPNRVSTQSAGDG